MRVRFLQTATGRLQCEDALEALAYRNAREMRRAALPALYEAGVQYRTDPSRRMHWLTASQVARGKEGDCADLSAYRIAELRLAGVPAVFKLKHGGRPGLYHVYVGTPYGEEDPSKRLGME